MLTTDRSGANVMCYNFNVGIIYYSSRIKANLN